MNYDASKIGVPYVRAHRIVIEYPDSGKNPSAAIYQSMAIRLADGTIKNIENIEALNVEFDFALNGSTLIPLVNPDDASHLGTDTTLINTMLSILAVVRSEQLKADLLK